MAEPSIGTNPEALQRIGKIAAAAAADVDAKARFPTEALSELRNEKLLSAFVPRELGGFGQGIAELSATCESLGQHCSSAAMVLAMHHIQVACIARHRRDSSFFRDYLRELSAKQNLIASVTSEVGVGGSMRTSVCAVEPAEPGFRLVKDATTISYGEHAEDLLVTSRRAPDAPAGDQVLVLLRKGDYQLEKKGEWDTLGMRGTCSPPCLVTSKGDRAQILPVPFADISGQTMVPFSHILWSSLWLGIATAAVGKARTFVRDQARKTPGQTPPSALRLAEAATRLQVMRASVHDVAAECDRLMRSAEGEAALASIGFALKMNNLKISCSEMVVSIVHHALQICGIAGYKNNSPLSLGRQFRDALSAALMIGNDRIYATNASLMLIHKDN